MKKINLFIIALFFVNAAIAQWYWQNPLPQGHALYSVMFPSSTVGYAVGDAGTVVKTIDAGANWTALSNATPNSLNSVYFTDDNTGYAVGQFGTIIATKNGGGYPVVVNEINPASGSLRLYPNPTYRRLTIETPEKGTLSVFNLNGMLLLQRELTEPSATIDVNSLPGGVYVVKLVGERGVQVGKFIKQ